MWFRSGFCKPSFRQLCRYKCNYHVLPSSSLHFDSAGHSLALLTQPHTPLSKTDSTSSKRDSFSAVSKEQTYLDSSGILLGGEEETVSERLKDWCVLIFFSSIHPVWTIHKPSQELEHSFSFPRVFTGCLFLFQLNNVM